MLASHCGAVTSTGNDEMSVFQTLSTGNIGQLAAPGSGVPAETAAPGSITPSPTAIRVSTSPAVTGVLNDRPNIICPGPPYCAPGG